MPNDVRFVSVCEILYILSLYRRQQLNKGVEVIRELEKRVDDVKKLRKGHSSLISIVESTFVGNKVKMTVIDLIIFEKLLVSTMEEIDRAYHVFQNVDALAVSQEEWKYKTAQYNKIVETIEVEVNLHQKVF